MKDGREHSSTLRPGARPRLFISYRRRFDGASARLLKTVLDKAFGEGAAFLDVADIRPGETFPESIREAIESCDVFLALISHGWLGVVGELQDPDDFVRREIAAALARRVTIIPVLLGDTRMPEPKELPGEIRDLAFRNAIRLSDEHWDDDVARLVRHVPAREGSHRPDPSSGGITGTFGSSLSTSRGKAVATLAAAAVFLFAGVLGLGYALWLGLLRTDFEACLRAMAQGRSGAEKVGLDSKVELGNRDVPVVREEQYKSARDGGEDFRFIVRLTDSGKDVGAVLLRFHRAAEPADSAFTVERVVAPPCDDVQDYRNDSRPAADKQFLKNWDTLHVSLGGRDYYLRIGDRGTHVLATLTPPPSQ